MRLTGRCRVVSLRALLETPSPPSVPDRSVRNDEEGKNNLETEEFKADTNDSSQSRTPWEAASRIGNVGEEKVEQVNIFDCASGGSFLLFGEKVNGTASNVASYSLNAQRHGQIDQIIANR